MLDVSFSKLSGQGKERRPALPNKSNNTALQEFSMELYCFASATETNIWAGIGAELWAVAPSSNDSFMQGRRTKAAKMPVGSLGLLYCNRTSSFTTPFVVLSQPDPVGVIKDVWPEEWCLPFKIRPLGSPAKQIPGTAANNLWPVLIAATSNTTATMNLTGTTVFVPKEISPKDWALIMGDLAI